MGCGYEGFCSTCRKRVWLGYGSARTWANAHETAEEFENDAHNIEHASLHKNQNMHRFIKEHEGHDFRVLNDDYVDHGDDIVDPFCGDSVVVAGGVHFEKENWYDD